MRIVVKLTGTLIAGICVIATIDAIQAWRREVRFFEHDMRLDHAVVADAVAAMVRKSWAEEGKAGALRVPHAIEQPGRHLSLRLLDPTDRVPDLPPAARASLQSGEVRSARDGVHQDTFLAITGPAGDQLVLEIEEPLAEERVFMQTSSLRTASAAAALVVLCTALTVVLGHLWVGRPIRTLCDGARRIAGGDLSGGLRVGSDDEFSVLATRMNDMCAALAQARVTLAEETERRVATLEQLRHADRLATVGKLASGIAHELGTPLNVVWAHAQMIAREEVVGGEVKDSAGTIAAQTERMTKIIRQLLDFARPRPPVKTDTDLGELIRQTLTFLSSLAEKRGVELAWQVPLAHRAEVDATQLQQVLTNLVVNAVQATPAGGKVTVGLTRTRAQPPPDVGGAVADVHRIDVRDTGSGIAPETMLHLFEPFFTTKEVGEGTGLGLSVARGIVREHRGWIAAASAAGAGACFSVFLPAEPG